MFGWNLLELCHYGDKSCGHEHCDIENVMFLICHVMIYYHLDKFGGHRYCNGRDIMILVCHMIKQDPTIKGPGYYNDRSP